MQLQIIALIPGQSSLFDRVAMQPISVGAAPPELMEAHVLKNLAYFDKILGSVPLSEGNLVTLVDRVNDNLAEMRDLEKKIEELNAQSGVRAKAVVEPIRALEASAKKGEDVIASTMELGRVTLLVMEKGLYQRTFDGMPDVLGEMERVASDEVISGLDSKIENISSRFDDDDWILFDEEPPLEKTWVFAIYAVLALMIILNLRKLWRFYIAWKS